jgi:hypothetical protein
MQNENPGMKKMILWLPFLLILFAGVHQDAGAAEWTPFVEDKAFKHFYDKQSLAHLSQGLIRVAIKVDPKGKEGRDFLLKVRQQIGLSLEGYENYGFSLTVMEIDCPNNRKRILQSDDYTKKGEPLDASTSPNPKWAEISPDSVHGLYRKVLCK